MMEDNNTKTSKKGSRRASKNTSVPDGPLPEDLQLADPTALISWDTLSSLSKDGEIIGHGITSTIYSMKWNRKIGEETRQEDVAVKLFDLSEGRKQKVWSWHHEDELYTALGENENLVKYYGRGIKNNNAIFLVFELATVGYLWNLMAMAKRDHRQIPKFRATPLPDVIFPDLDWLHIILDIAKGMRFLSESSIIHRDLTVKNILVFQVGENKYKAKVSDLGLASYFNQDEGILRGSTRHYAPESIQSKEKGSYVSKSDVYMFANIVYEMGHGREIFRQHNTLEVRDLVVKGERPLFEVMYREDIETLIRDCWHPDPKHRPSFFDICYTLEEIITKAASNSEK